RRAAAPSTDRFRRRGRARRAGDLFARVFLCGSVSLALELALRGFGVGRGDEAVLPAPRFASGLADQRSRWRGGRVGRAGAVKRPGPADHHWLIEKFRRKPAAIETLLSSEAGHGP